MHKRTNLKLISFKINCTFILILFLSNIISFAQTNSCQAIFKVEENRNIRSTPLGGTYYAMEITNAGTSKDTYSLASQNINSSCTNPEGENTSENVNLTATFVDANLITINQIVLNSGQTSKFLVNITVPTNTLFNKWNCIEITATSTNCSPHKLSTVLHTLVSDPTMD